MNIWIEDYMCMQAQNCSLEPNHDCKTSYLVVISAIHWSSCYQMKLLKFVGGSAISTGARAGMGLVGGPLGVGGGAVLEA